MKHINDMGNPFTGHRGMLPVLLAVMVAFIMVVSVSMSWANEEPPSLEEAYIFFELNDTDGDLGIHAKIDGDAWRRLVIRDLYGRKMLGANARGRLGRQGLTELFFESAEPPFCEDGEEEDCLDPEDFFYRFPEGYYYIKGITTDWEVMKETVTISHVMPAPPEVSLNGNPAAEDCDAEELPEFGVGETITISWDAVKTSHPDIGTPGQPIEVENYEVVVEIDETPWVTSIILPNDVTEFVIPAEILALAEFDEEDEAEVKFEVLVRATNWNQTAVESCFVLVE